MNEVLGLLRVAYQAEDEAVEEGALLLDEAVHGMDSFSNQWSQVTFVKCTPKVYQKIRLIERILGVDFLTLNLPPFRTLKAITIHGFNNDPLPLWKTRRIDTTWNHMKTLQGIRTRFGQRDRTQ